MWIKSNRTTAQNRQSCSFLFSRETFPPLVNKLQVVFTQPTGVRYSMGESLLEASIWEFSSQDKCGEVRGVSVLLEVLGWDSLPMSTKRKEPSENFLAAEMSLVEPGVLADFLEAGASFRFPGQHASDQIFRVCKTAARNPSIQPPVCRACWHNPFIHPDQGLCQMYSYRFILTAFHHQQDQVLVENSVELFLARAATHRC